jgi:hypothetical protein
VQKNQDVKRFYCFGRQVQGNGLDSPANNQSFKESSLACWFLWGRGSDQGVRAAGSKQGV